MSLYSHLTDAELIPYLEKRVNNCKAGQISSYVENWRQITSDQTIINIVEGDSIEFEYNAPIQTFIQNNSFDDNHEYLIEKEIQSLLSKQVIVTSKHESN